MPKVSVVVPNYNHGRFIGRRLDSIYTQTYQDRDIVILDDASTDDSRDVIAPYLDRPGTRFVPSEVNSGNVFGQWRKGLESSSSEYVWFAESDDAASSHLLSTLVGVLDSDPQMGLAYAQSWMIDKGGAILSDAAEWTADLDPYRWTRDFRNEGNDEIRDFLVQKNTIPNASAALIRRRALPDLEWTTKTPMRLCGDWLLWVKILAQWRIGFSSRRLNFWRQSSSNARIRLDGVLEATEGQRVIEEACKSVDLDELACAKWKIRFLERCIKWQEASVEKLSLS